MNENLIFEGNAVYEIDPECVQAKQKKEMGTQCRDKTMCKEESVTVYENDEKRMHHVWFVFWLVMIIQAQQNNR